MSALPRNLVPMPKQRQVPGIKSQTIEISPTNGSFNTAYNPLDRVIFQVPAYPNGFCDTSKSFLKFKPTLTATGTINATDTPFIADGMPIIERMIVKSGSGAVLEDIQDVDLLDNLLEGMMEKSAGSARKALTGDGLTGPSKYNRQNNKTCVKHLSGGLWGASQEYYLPLHLMGGPYAFEIELVLNNASRCMAVSEAVPASLSNPSYSISGVSLQLEIVNMPEDVCKKLDAAICGGENVSLPFSSYKSFRNIIPTASTQASIQIHEVSPNVEEVLLALEDTSVKTATEDRYTFDGGSEGSFDVLAEYQFRYADRYMPLQPVKDLNNGSAAALANILRDIKVQNPAICEVDANGIPAYFKDKFFILQNMEVDKGLISGLSTQNHSGPIEAFLKFAAATTASIRATSFVKSTHALNVSKDGVAGLGMV